MKILFVLDRGNLYGGVQKMMAEVAVALAEQHHDQVGVMMAYIDDNKMEDYLQRHHVRVHNLRCRKYSPLLPFRYARVIRKYRYEVVHTNHSFSQIFGGIASLLVPKTVRFFSTEHSLDSVRRRHAWFRPVDRFCYRRYACVHAVSHCVRDRLLAWVGADMESRVDVIANGVDVPQLVSSAPLDRKSLGCTDGDTIVCTISRLVESKDLKTLIRAMALLPDNFKCVIVGDGAEEENLKNLSKAEGLENRILFMGRRTDIGPILKSADVYVSTSLSEGFGLTIIEASVCGLPVAATDIPAFRELIYEEQLFSPGDAKTLAEKIMGWRSLPLHMDFREKYSLTQMADLYRKAMASS